MRNYNKEKGYGGLNSKPVKIIIVGLFVIGYSAYKVKKYIIKNLSLNQQDTFQDIYF